MKNDEEEEPESDEWIETERHRRDTLAIYAKAFVAVTIVWIFLTMFFAMYETEYVIDYGEPKVYYLDDNVTVTVIPGPGGPTIYVHGPTTATVNNVAPELINFTLDDGYLGTTLQDNNTIYDISYISLEINNTYINNTYEVSGGMQSTYYYEWFNNTIQFNSTIIMRVWDGSYFTNFTISNGGGYFVVGYGTSTENDYILSLDDATTPEMDNTDYYVYNETYERYNSLHIFVSSWEFKKVILPEHNEITTEKANRLNGGG